MADVAAVDDTASLDCVRASAACDETQALRVELEFLHCRRQNCVGRACRLLAIDEACAASRRHDNCALALRPQRTQRPDAVV